MKKLLLFLSFIFSVLSGYSSEVNLKIPDLKSNYFENLGIDGWSLLFYGIIIILLGMLFGFYQFMSIKKLPAHKSMLNVSNTIYETCKTYLLQQGKFLLILFAIIGSAIFYYFFGLSQLNIGKVLLILFWSVIGILGSYSVAWFGVRINTYANSRTAFASLKKRPFDVVRIPLQAGMSIGLLLICVELIMMLIILLFVPGDAAGACFIGFAIGESLGASVLRICGGIFTKIADIGSDLMKIVFNIKEDDPRNPGVIADCTGDNAGDSIGPTADGFETYGVTGVALITFIVLAVIGEPLQASFIVWIFTMRLLMVITSLVSYYINHFYSKAKYGNSDKFNFEAPLTNLVWLTSIISIIVTYLASYVLLASLGSPESGLWWKLSTIISCGTLAAALIPELTKAFTSSRSTHVNEIVQASREGGSSLTILSGLVAGNYSAFWQGLVMAALMFIGFITSTYGLSEYMAYPAIFAFGLVAFGFLGMGPVTIAVDSYGPVTDNAQSIFELSQIEKVDNIKSDFNKQYGFEPDFERGKHFLEENDSAGNTFKATAKPVLIGTAVVGATTMIFSIILILKGLNLWEGDLTNAWVVLGFIAGGAVVYWFTGASIQAVTTGAYRAVEFIKKNLNLNKQEADINDSKTVVKICTQYAQKGMWNIFITILSLTLAFAFFNPNFFVAYLISIAVFGLFQAIFMANAGGAWDNAKKLVEVDLKEKNTPLHEATVVGDTVGDPYKDTSSVALNPIIKFSTLFGLLAAEIAIEININARDTGSTNYGPYIGLIFFVIGLVFVYRSFYKMRIEK
ncbi:MAG: sodium-translocating pyrophosphatase [Bacteroidales bacterium]|nr:sodium-translocating pyrophosphatase [Bacteroidales bacterium]